MIRIESLVKTYGTVRALDGLSLNVEPGAVYGFLGPNGAGKTTSMCILSGLARPDSGRAWILDKEIGQPGQDGSTHNPVRQGIAERCGRGEGLQPGMRVSR